VGVPAKALAPKMEKVAVKKPAAKRGRKRA
jgi:hypothetical protein